MHVNQTKLERFFSVYQSKMCRFVILSFRSRSTRNWARTLASVLKADASAWAAQSGRPFFWVNSHCPHRDDRNLALYTKRKQGKGPPRDW